MRAIPAEPRPGKARRYASAESGSVISSELREALRVWRKNTAARQGVPAFVVMHDTTLDAVCAKCPKTLAELRAVPGIGQKKLETYGDNILKAIFRFQNGAQAPTKPAPLSPPATETLRLLQRGHSLEQVAKLRNVTIGTVSETVAKLIEEGEFELPSGLLAEDRVKAIEGAYAKFGEGPFRPIKDALPEEITYNEIRIVVAELKRRVAKAATSAAIA